MLFKPQNVFFGLQPLFPRNFLRLFRGNPCLPRNSVGIFRGNSEELVFGVSIRKFFFINGSIDVYISKNTSINHLDGPKRNNVIDRLDYPIDRSRISSVPRNVLGKSRTFFYKRIDRCIYIQKRIDRSLRWTKA